MKADDERATCLGFTHAQEIDRDVGWDRNDAAAITNEDAALAIDRDLALASGQNGAKAFAAKQRRRLHRHGLQLRSPGARHHNDGKRSEQGDDEHHRHDFDQREARLAVMAPRSRCRRLIQNHPPVRPNRAT